MSDLAAQPITTSRRAQRHAWRNSVNAWLLLLPAAVLLATFTHYPIVATIQHSFFITRRSGDPLFVGFDNYRSMFEDSIFWKVLWNNFIFAAGTIPTSIALALLMALWVNRNMRGRGFLRLAYFTPTILPMIAVANI
ncbi:MAG: sugar ABC transporter permease, partial [Pseudorhodoplanes sp.]|nr:sugar ABC transporter permease [Pseudorhodoplanes sp.]